MQAGLEAWWGRWRRRSGTQHGHARELEVAARSREEHTPSDALREWLRGLGWDGDRLAAREAEQWAAVWRQQQHARRGARLPRRIIGEGVRRGPAGRTCATGRRLFGRFHKGGMRVLDGEGRLCGSDRAAERALWHSREPIWATQPPLTGAAEPLLDHYFRNRAAGVSGARPTWERLMGLVLRPGCSAAGVDGIPYELYQVSPVG